MNRSRLLLGVAIVSIAAAVMLWVQRDDDEVAAREASAPDGAHGAGERRFSSGGFASPRSGDEGEGSVVITGKVVDKGGGGAVGGVEVVFLSGAGEETTTANDDGTYRIVVPRGVYRAFVRDETVLTVGYTDRVRLPGLPSADTIGVPDEAAMPMVAANRDTTGVDISVLRGGVVVGKVVDRSGRPIKGAVLRARSQNGIKPALGTDVAESDANGAFELRLPAGDYELDAAHARYAGVGDSRELYVSPGDHLERTVTLAAGCVIAGRVVGPDGKAAGDGAIEKQWGETDHEFRPDGKISADGSFRWTTTAETRVTLRAWPWKAPPSASQSFDCGDGARFESVVFQLPPQNADIEGLLVDATGAPVPLAFIDLAPLDEGGIAQQERSDGDGTWGVYHMPKGSYRLTAYAKGLGVATMTVESPQRDVRVALGGTGKLTGSAPNIGNGSFDLRVTACTADTGDQIEIADDQRLVTVVNGRFTVDNVPACNLQVVASWQQRTEAARVAVSANGTSFVELAIGPPQPKIVSGVVKDEAGRPVDGAFVAALFEDSEASATTDSTGRFRLETFGGALITASHDGMHGNKMVGTTKVDHEDIDIVIVDGGRGDSGEDYPGDFEPDDERGHYPDGPTDDETSIDEDIPEPAEIIE